MIVLGSTVAGQFILMAACLPLGRYVLVKTPFEVVGVLSGRRLAATRTILCRFR